MWVDMWSNDHLPLLTQTKKKLKKLERSLQCTYIHTLNFQEHLAIWVAKIISQLVEVQLQTTVARKWFHI
jgi:hypothetical protein